MSLVSCKFTSVWDPPSLNHPHAPSYRGKRDNKLYTILYYYYYYTFLYSYDNRYNRYNINSHSVFQVCKLEDFGQP